MKKGLLIVFEGGDGVGKTTQVQLMLKYLLSQGKKAKVVHAISGTRIGQQIRRILLNVKNKEMKDLTEALLLQAARAQVYSQVINPGVKNGEIILMDRSADSSVVYQGIARGLGIDLIKRFNKISTGGTRPDITFLLDAPAKVGLARIKKVEDLDRLENAGLHFHQQVRQGYLELYKEDGGQRMIKIDATKNIEEVHEKCKNYLKSLLD